MKNLTSTAVLAMVFTLLFSQAVFSQTKDEFHLDKEYSIDPQGTIHLQSDDAKVTITGSDRSSVHVKVHYLREAKGVTFGKMDKFGMLVEEDGGDLRIYEKDKGKESRQQGTFVGSVHEEYTISIEAPRGVSLKLEGDDERYEISGIDGSLEADADDTDFDIRDCSGDRFSFSLDDGSLQMDKGKGSLQIDIDDGEVNIGVGEFKEIELDTDDSRIEIGTRLFDDGRYRFDMDDAELSLNIAGGGGVFEVHHDNADIRVDSGFEQQRNKEHETVYRLAGGNADVVIDTDDGAIELRVI